MARIFEYFVVCGIGPEIRTLDGDKGFHGAGVFYLPSLLDQYPPLNHSLYPPPPPQLSTVTTTTNYTFSPILFLFFLFLGRNLLFWVEFWCLIVLDKLEFIIFLDLRGILKVMLGLRLQCVLPAGVEFYSSGFDANDASTSPRSYPIVLTGASQISTSLIRFLNLRAVKCFSLIR